MANVDKNLVITPNVGSSSQDPSITFSGADNSLAAQSLTARIYPTSNGTLSFEGSAGQLFSITNSLTGTLYSVNDGSGLPSIEVFEDGVIRLARYSGRVLVGNVTDNGVDTFQFASNTSFQFASISANGNVSATTSLVANTVTTPGPFNLTINTNSGANSGAIVVNQGTNGNIAITPNGSGSTTIKNISTANQITSTVATGTAPFVLSSNTVVANLNANLLEGKNSAYFENIIANIPSIWARSFAFMGA